MSEIRPDGLAGLPNPTLTRRDLLLLGAAGAASLLLTGVATVAPALDLSPVASLLGEMRRPLPVGFWDHSGGDSNAAVVDAAGISATANSARFLSDGARMSILGLYPRENVAALEHLETVAIDVLYTPYHDQVFRAWEFTNGVTPRVSSPVAVTVPVDKDAGMSVRLTYRLAGTETATSSSATFTLGSDSRSFKLREGVYLIALPDAGAALPSWSQFRASEVGAGDRGPHAIHRYAWNAGHGRAATQPYVMLSIE